MSNTNTKKTNNSIEPTKDPKSPLYKKVRVSHVFDNEFKHVIKHGMAKKIRERYEKYATPYEKELMDDMLGLMTDPLQVAHFFLGGHIQLENDGGEYCDKWMRDFKGPRIDSSGEQIPGPLRIRRSSHESHGAPQGSFDGPVLRHILFSTRRVAENDSESARYTWLQLENSPIKSIKEIDFWSPISVLRDILSALSHMLDFFKYRITGRNIGAYGASKYTEKNPLKIDISAIDQSNLAARAELWKEIIINRQGMNLGDLKERMDAVGIKFAAAKNDPAKPKG